MSLALTNSPWYASVMTNDDQVIAAADLENPGSFAVRLWHARSAVPMTQEELAQRSGLQQSAVAHYEAGRREPSVTNLRRLVLALGCGADYLLATRPETDADYGAPTRPARRCRIDATESALRELGVGPIRSLRCAELAEEDGAADPALWHRACVGLVRDLGPDGFSSLESPCAVESFRLMLRDAVAALQRPVAQASPDVRASLLCALADGMSATLAAGDVEAARIAHETIGRLLGAPGTGAAGIIDLAAERDRRGL